MKTREEGKDNYKIRNKTSSASSTWCVVWMCRERYVQFFTNRNLFTRPPPQNKYKTSTKQSQDKTGRKDKTQQKARQDRQQTKRDKQGKTREYKATRNNNNIRRQHNIRHHKARD